MKSMKVTAFTGWRIGPISRITIAAVLGMLLAMPPVVAQITTSTPPEPPTGADGRPLAFEVVSIKRNMSAPGTEQQSFGPTADGYHMRDLFIQIPILTAYIPQNGGRASYLPAQLVGFPDWLNNDAYDIDAKVSESDLADWRSPAKQPAMLRAMLQAMLEDRLKLRVHRSAKEVPVYSLVVAKGGPKFKETNPQEPHPAGLGLPGGGGSSLESRGGVRIRHYYGVSMATVASLLSQGDRPVQDDTGLTGRWDIAFPPTPIPACAPHCGAAGAAPAEDSSVFDIAQHLGLKLIPAKGRVDVLVIDHIERPSEN
jgi:bla regulator protein BlaR1